MQYWQPRKKNRAPVGVVNNPWKDTTQVPIYLPVMAKTNDFLNLLGIQDVDYVAGSFVHTERVHIDWRRRFSRS